MLNDADRICARFAPNDPVMFAYRRGKRTGTLARTNPKRAVVLVNNEEYNVPYELLIPLNDAGKRREERIENILRQAQESMRGHGLKKWQFGFDRSTRRAGCCNYREKTISISFELARNGSDEDVHDTILHEIAHALVGRKHNHDAVWKAKAREIGCSGERCHRLTFSTPRYRVTCENQCWAQTAERRNRRLICRTCGGKLVYSPFCQQPEHRTDGEGEIIGGMLDASLQRSVASGNTEGIVKGVEEQT